MKKQTIALLLALALLVTVACGGENTEKNAGESAPIATNEEQNLPELESMALSNSDGSITMSIPSFSVGEGTLPILPCKIESISAELAQRVATALFGENTIYEYSARETRAQLKELIAAYEVGVTDAAIRADYGENVGEDIYADVKDGRERLLNYYRSAYEYAGETEEPTPCEWKFYADSHYFSPAYDGSDPIYTEIPYGVSAEIRATVNMGGLSYIYSAHNLEKEGFYDHSISAYLREPFPTDSEELVSWMKTERLYSETPPSEEQLAAAKEKAEQLSAAFGLGQWDVVASVNDHAIGMGQKIRGTCITAECRRIIGGAADLSFLQRGAVSSESLRFLFTNDGRLLAMDLYNPVSVGTAADDVSIPGADALKTMLVNAAAQLQPSDSSFARNEYRFTRAEFGYAEHEGSLRPALVLSGTVVRSIVSGGEYIPLYSGETQLALDLQSEQFMEYHQA